jgi:aerobic-type carbon monoxide dehydrogenase small subunit (CoxS/CutS family)
MRVTLRVNGSAREVEVSPADTLLTVLRDALDLTGTKYGNALADATGVRLRSLPLVPSGLTGSTTAA